ncbi:MAG TPA: hypothetical protein VJ788_01465 [Gemmatimonadota bacterium]|nr:hypothetical protein [Gemmatimonadota bacterium]
MKRGLRARQLPTIVGIACAVLTGCGTEAAPDRAAGTAPQRPPVEIAHYPLSADAVPAGADAAFDPDVSQDGGGSLRVVTGKEGGRLRLYRLDDVRPVEGALVYTGFLKSQDLDGTGYFELWCHPAEGNAAFARGVPTGVSGSSDWKPQEVSFRRPETCSDPSFLELNVVIHGSGTVWIDNIRLWDVPVE